MQEKKTSENLYLFPTDNCLLDTIIEELAPLSAEELKQTLVVLPTQRLGTYLIAALAQKRTAFFAPKVTTLENFIFEHAAYETSKIIPDIAVELILASIIQKGDYNYIRPVHARELRVFFSEIVDTDLKDATFEKLTDVLQEDFYHSEQHLGSLESRINEIADIYQKLNKTLLDTNQRSTALALSQASSKLLDLLTSKEKLPYYRSIFAGFTSVAPSIKKLLQKLISMKNVTFWLSEAPQLASDYNPLEDLITTLSQYSDIKRPLQKQKPKKRKVTIVNKSNHFNEIATVLDQCKTLIENGFPPSQIAILITNEYKYGPILRSLVPQTGIEVNLAISSPLETTVSGSFLKTLTDFFLSGEETILLLDLLLNPITLKWLKKADEEEPLNRETIKALIIKEVTDIGIERSISRVRSHSQDIKFCKLLDHFTSAIETFRKLLSNSLPFSLWLKHFDELVNTFQPFDDSFETKDIALSAQEAVETFTSSLTKVSEQISFPIPGKEFWRIIKDQLLKLDIRSVGEPLSGIQILGLSEARYFPFEYLFITGCNEGSFPKALPKDDLIDDFLKRRIGLPGWRSLEAMEDLTFTLLKSRLPNLQLTRPTQSMGDPMVRSRFIERLLCEKEGEVIEASYDLETLFNENIEEFTNQNPETKEGELKQIRPDIFQRISASSLESLIHCPYKFLLSKLGLRDLSIPTPISDSKKEGEWLHAVLEAFFTCTYLDKEIIAPWPEPLTMDYFEKYALPRMLDLTKKIGPYNIEKTALYIHLKLHSWPRFIEHIKSLFAAKDIPYITKGLREFSLPSKRIFSVFGQNRQFSGKIDSIDTINSVTVICDYKRRSIPPSKKSKLGLSPQLSFYIYALSHINKNLNLDKSITGYWSIIDGKWEARGIGDQVKSWAIEHKISKTSKPLDLNELIDSMLNLWRWREEDILQKKGRFFADPSQCGLCNFNQVCRKDSPEWKELLEQQKDLQNKLDNSESTKKGGEKK